jgi:hypothetical protein
MPTTYLIDGTGMVRFVDGAFHAGDEVALVAEVESLLDTTRARPSEPARPLEPDPLSAAKITDDAPSARFPDIKPANPATKEQGKARSMPPPW